MNILHAQTDPTLLDRLKQMLGSSARADIAVGYFFISGFETLADDVGSPRRWWENRMLRIMLVFVFTTFGSIIGTYVGGYEIVSNLF